MFWGVTIQPDAGANLSPIVTVCLRSNPTTPGPQCWLKDGRSYMPPPPPRPIFSESLQTLPIHPFHGVRNLLGKLVACSLFGWLHFHMGLFFKTRLFVSCQLPAGYFACYQHRPSDTVVVHLQTVDLTLESRVPHPSTHSTHSSQDRTQATNSWHPLSWLDAPSDVLLSTHPPPPWPSQLCLLMPAAARHQEEKYSWYDFFPPKAAHLCSQQHYSQ